MAVGFRLNIPLPFLWGCQFRQPLFSVILLMRVLLSFPEELWKLLIKTLTNPVIRHKRVDFPQLRRHLDIPVLCNPAVKCHHNCPPSTIIYLSGKSMTDQPCAGIPINAGDISGSSGCNSEINFAKERNVSSSKPVLRLFLAPYSVIELLISGNVSNL